MDIPTPLAILQETRRLIERPEQWIKRSSRINDEWPNNYSFCIYGAFSHVVLKTFKPYKETAISDKAWNIMLRCLPKGQNSIICFNDHPDTTHEQILSVLDRAIKRQKRLDFFLYIWSFFSSSKYLPCQKNSLYF